MLYHHLLESKSNSANAALPVTVNEETSSPVEWSFSNALLLVALKVTDFWAVLSYQLS